MLHVLLLTVFSWQPCYKVRHTHHHQCQFFQFGCSIRCSSSTTVAWLWMLTPFRSCEKFIHFFFTVLVNWHLCCQNMIALCSRRAWAGFFWGKCDNMRACWAHHSKCMKFQIWFSLSTHLACSCWYRCWHAGLEILVMGTVGSITEGGFRFSLI